jgi:hypothetical protein
MTEVILLLLAISALSINLCLVVLIFKMLFGWNNSAAEVAPEEEMTDKRRKELEYQQWLQEGLDNIMQYDGSPRKERDSQ